MSSHSPIGASSAERFFNCPGSVALLQQCPPQKDTVYSATGTVAHGVAERWLASGDRTTKFILKETGKSFVQGGFEVEVTENMAEAVEDYVTAIWETLDKYRLHPSDLRIEVGFTLPHIDPDARGTCDAAVVVPLNRLIIFDYKHGQGYAVEVEHNKQLLYYALGAYYALSESERADLIYVELVIVQPRARHADGGVRKHVISIEALLEYEVALHDAIRAVRSADSTLRVGNWCKFCGAKAICPATREELGRSAGLHFTKVDSEPVNLPGPATLSPERLAHLMKNADRIEDWCKAIKSFCIATAATGQEVPGYKFVEKTGNRRWKDESTIEAVYGPEFGEDIFNKKMKTPAQFEKLLGKARKSEIESMVEKPITGTTLVAVDDEREEVSAKAVDLFSPV